MPRNLKRLKAQLKKQRGVDGVSAPENQMLDYYRALVKHSRNVAKILQETVIAAIETYDQSHGLVQDSLSDSLTLSWKAFNGGVDELTSAQLAANVFVKSATGTDKFHRKKFVANVKKAIGVDITAITSEERTGELIQEALQENIKLIKSIKTDYQERAQKIIEEALLSGADFTNLKNELLQLGGFRPQDDGIEIRRAKTIARDQMLRLTAKISEIRQKEAGVTHYFWDTAGDRRVRDSHKRNRGKRFAWDNPPDTGHPGDEINCRCIARPDITTLIEQEEKII